MKKIIKKITFVRHAAHHFDGDEKDIDNDACFKIMIQMYLETEVNKKVNRKETTSFPYLNKIE